MEETDHGSDHLFNTRKIYLNPVKLLISLLMMIAVTGSAYAREVQIIVAQKHISTAEQLSNTLTEQLGLQVHTRLLKDFDAASLTTDDIVLTIGNAAAQKVSTLQLSQPVLYSFSQQQVLPTTGNWTATVLSQPVKRLLAAIDPLLKQNYKNNILIAVSADNREALRQLNALTASQKNQLDIIQVPANEKPAKYIEDKLFNAGALIAINDQNIWSGENARWMLYQAYRYQVPVVGYSKNFLKAGALLSVYSTIEQITATTVAQLKVLLTKGDLEQKGIIYSDYNIEYNHNIARALDISVPKNRLDIGAEQ